MYSLIKCGTFTVYASNLLDSVNILVVNVSGCNQYIVSVCFWVLRHWQVFVWVCQKSLVFFGLTMKVASEPM